MLSRFPFCAHTSNSGFDDQSKLGEVVILENLHTRYLKWLFDITYESNNCIAAIHTNTKGKQVAYFPDVDLWAKGSIPRRGAVCPFGFQSILASAGFFPAFLHLKLTLDFFNLYLLSRVLFWKAVLVQDYYQMSRQAGGSLQKYAK